MPSPFPEASPSQPLPSLAFGPPAAAQQGRCTVSWSLAQLSRGAPSPPFLFLNWAGPVWEAEKKGASKPGGSRSQEGQGPLTPEPEPG